MRFVIKQISNMKQVENKRKSALCESIPKKLKTVAAATSKIR